MNSYQVDRIFSEKLLSVLSQDRKSVVTKVFFMEVVIISRNTELENTRIVQIVQLSNLNGSQLKDMLAKIKHNTFASTSTTSIPLTKIERKTERKYFFMEKTSKELLKKFVNSQQFTSTTDIVDSQAGRYNTSQNVPHTMQAGICITPSRQAYRLSFLRLSFLRLSFLRLSYKE